MQFKGFFSDFKKDLKQRNRWRERSGPRSLDFCSNDYLGFASSHEIHEFFLERLDANFMGSGSSPLIRGQHPGLVDLEERLAQRCDVEMTLFFASGYQANLALYSALPAEATVFSDQRNHASIIDGLRLGAAEKKIFRHNDVGHLRSQLRACPPDGLKFVVVESRYSMGGDTAPLLELAELCEQHGAHLCVDEAHASGLHGLRGTGLVEDLQLTDRIFARVHTAGKAFGVGGAWISGSAELGEFLTNTSRPLIYSTGTSPVSVALMDAALQFWDQVGASRAKEALRRTYAFYQSLSPLWETGVVKTPYQEGPILPLVLGSDQRALAASSQLLLKGYDVRAIRPPTVPQGESLLRITLPWGTASTQIDQFSHDLQKTILEGVS